MNASVASASALVLPLVISFSVVEHDLQDLINFGYLQLLVEPTKPTDSGVFQTLKKTSQQFYLRRGPF